MNKLQIEAYFELNHAHHKPAMRLIRNLNLTGNEKILDIGCGDGKLTAELSLLVPNGSVLGIDTSIEIIDFARSKFPNIAYPNLGFKVGDAQNLSFSNEFDLVVSFGCLNSIAEHTPILKGVFNSLKKFGRLSFQFLAKADSHDLQSLILNLLKSDKWMNKLANKVEYAFYDVEEYCKVLNTCDLYPKKVNLCIEGRTYQGKAGFSHIMHNTWLSLSSRMPEDLYPDFIQDLADIYVQHNPSDDYGVIRARSVWLEVIAQKI